MKAHSIICLTVLPQSGWTGNGWIEIEGVAGRDKNCPEQGVRTEIIPYAKTPHILRFSEENSYFLMGFFESFVIGETIAAISPKPF